MRKFTDALKPDGYHVAEHVQGQSYYPLITLGSHGDCPTARKSRTA